MEYELHWIFLTPQKVGAKIGIYIFFKNPNPQRFERADV